MLRLREQRPHLLRGGDDDLADEECRGDGGCFGRGRVGVLGFLVGMRKPPVMSGRHMTA